MKLKSIIFSSVILFATILEAQAWSPVSGLGDIKTRGLVLCGSNLSVNTFAQKNKNGEYEGVDATLCSILSVAIFGSPTNYKLVHVNSGEGDNAIAAGKVDIMLGNSYSTAGAEIEGNSIPAATLYFDRLMMLAKTEHLPKSMLEFENQNVCIVPKSPDWENFDNYLRKYQLNLRPLKFADFQSAKASFLLNRCKLLVGDETILQTIKNDLKRPDIHLLPEEIDAHPIYLMVSKSNPDLQAAIKWIFNALIMAEENGITSKNVEIMTGDNNLSLRNLLGTNPKLWQKLGLQKDWVKKAIKLYGNYGEFYQKNVGEESKLKLPRGNARLIKDGGTFKSQVFL